MYIGIDNGVSGGIAAIADCGQLIDAWAMPIQSARKGNEVDAAMLDEWLSGWICAASDRCTVLLEEPGGSKSAKAATSMAGSFHAIRAILTIRGYRWHRITPQQWQRSLLPGCKAGDSKPRAWELAGRLWPDERFLATDRCRKPHDGMIDAALIGEYGRRANL